MSENQSVEKMFGSRIGFCSLLTIAFIILKLCKVITWSWWWVISPMLISIGLTILVLLVLLGVILCLKEK